MGWFENETIFTLFYKEKNFFLLISIFDLFSIKKIFGVDFFFFGTDFLNRRTDTASKISIRTSSTIIFENFAKNRRSLSIIPRFL